MISISSLEFHPYAGAQEEELEKVLQQQLTDEKENLLHSDLNLNQPIDTEIFLTNESAQSFNMPGDINDTYAHHHHHNSSIRIGSPNYLLISSMKKRETDSRASKIKPVFFQNNILASSIYESSGKARLTS